MTADIVPMPGAAATAPKRPRGKRAPKHASEWLEVASAAEKEGGDKGILVYETAEGDVGYRCTASISPVHGEALLREAVKLYNRGAAFTFSLEDIDDVS
jgi:hypothetical protein